MSVSCHILVEGNPIIIYASRNGHPQRMLAILKPFLKTFWQERDLSGERPDTPDCLAAQLVVRFGYEICEDDFSNLRIGLQYDPDVSYLYQVGLDQHITVWEPMKVYRQQPDLGLKGCNVVQRHPVRSPDKPNSP